MLGKTVKEYVLIAAKLKKKLLTIRVPFVLRSLVNHCFYMKLHSVLGKCGAECEQKTTCNTRKCTEMHRAPHQNTPRYSVHYTKTHHTLHQNTMFTTAKKTCTIPKYIVHYTTTHNGFNMTAK